MEWALDHPYASTIIAGVVLAILTRSPGFWGVLTVLVMIGIYFVLAPALTLISSHNDASAADHPPEQTMLPSPIVFKYNGQHRVKALASYVITARVLSVKSYPGEVVPIDVALGWGPMSDQNVISQLKFSQSQRFFNYQYFGQPPIPPQQFSLNSSNNHILAATAAVERQIESLQPGQFVSMGGYLVNIDDEDGYSWKTSLTRDDTGKGACELFYVQSVSVF